ncbi:hypothetical protein J7M28_01655, partial [bacterium]|nr:hypothetical protein [bacterium]
MNKNVPIGKIVQKVESKGQKSAKAKRGKSASPGARISFDAALRTQILKLGLKMTAKGQPSNCIKGASSSSRGKAPAVIGGASQQKRHSPIALDLPLEHAANEQLIDMSQKNEAITKRRNASRRDAELIRAHSDKSQPGVIAEDKAAEHSGSNSRLKLRLRLIKGRSRLTSAIRLTGKRVSIDKLTGRGRAAGGRRALAASEIRSRSGRT